MPETTSSSTPGPSFQQVRVEAILFGVITSMTTLVRLGIRVRIRKLWWDDAWALLALVFMLLYITGIFIYANDYPTRFSAITRIAGYYLCAQDYLAVVWASRQSILYTVLRLTFGRLRTTLFYVFWVFLGTWAILFAQIWWVCEMNPSWKSLVHAQCPLGRHVAIPQVAADVVGDAILVVSPLYLLSSVMNKALKIRVAAIFLTTTMSTAISLYHAYIVFTSGISLVVANLSVLIAFVFRLKPHQENDNVQPITTIGSKRVRRKAQTTTGLITLLPSDREPVTDITIDRSDNGLESSALDAGKEV
ncbi:hypothetical protein K488DRAFT_88038 [Vararia minispora EC-137]|uniref:Uncharacterized protein n=1 Tax=Vararia minispora EC-137 TaxID=1314806 RepID=A0ACB8QEZ0_9AGAM|nr:hypothetical protein K488DRAFT_88038 [Vararia minispora EC-137]